ncbi:hypothetical protein [Serpentinicella alkaliphila]|uniref:Uncharacterized protein n=1 Tax=Serpentinicella alkaliphila TaxID=1734049 RepID=A0A4R2TPB6_9FIRM|nr:hypothetical protein [Serpentinicella alkaliphila]QUH26351.1 hypothetical protein HZR23_11845 [Serpentinicella alkaliphila]TCP96792.1 hypothetical protein EDD79_10499 [Serpentinicella alkaliphila]
MIQIDDAGSGSLLGGTIIGVLRVETKEFHYDIIPLNLYHEESFVNKEYLNYVVNIVDKIFQNLKVQKYEEIQVCRGYMFDKLKQWFDQNNYRYISTEIKDPLQTKIEKAFEEYTISLGLPESFIVYTKYPFHFHRILKWVYADYENRHHLCKKGWKSWKKYSNLQIDHTQETIKSKNLVCLKCNNPIEQNSNALVKVYESNRINKIYLHDYCI